MNSVIIFKSNTGHTEQYANMLATESVVRSSR